MNKFKLHQNVYVIISSTRATNGELISNSTYQGTVIEINSAGEYLLRWIDGNISRKYYPEDKLMTQEEGLRERNTGPVPYDWIAERMRMYAGPS